MRIFGLIGFPLGHSWSKKYFTKKFENERIPGCTYELFPLNDISELPQLLALQPEIEGLNVTIPYKTAVIPFLDEISIEAREIGAVNVIKISRDNEVLNLKGYNSDTTGFLKSLKPYLSFHKSALVLGTGGSSKAVVYVLNKLGIQVTMVSRKQSDKSLGYSDLTRQIIETSDIIINTTPLGMFPDISSKPDIPYEYLEKKHLLYDLVYNPELTTFMKLGIEKGCRVISGYEMLKIQAERAWEIWNDEIL